MKFRQEVLLRLEWSELLSEIGKEICFRCGSSRFHRQAVCLGNSERCLTDKCSELGLLSLRSSVESSQQQIQ